MTAALIFAGVALVLMLVLVWLAHEASTPRPVHTVDGKPAIEELFPLHCQHLPQVLQALSKADEEYLRLRVSSASRRRVARERRAVVREFLAGLRQDFRRLDQLGRTVAAFSPEIQQEQETHRMRLALQFEFLCLRVRLRLALGRGPMPLLTRLTGLVGAQAAEIEAAMSRLEELSLSGVRADLSA